MSSQFYEEYKKDFYFNKEPFDNLIKHVVTDDLCSETYENILESFIQNYKQGRACYTLHHENIANKLLNLTATYQG